MKELELDETEIYRLADKSLRYPLAFNALESEYLQNLDSDQLDRLEKLLEEFELE